LFLKKTKDSREEIMNSLVLIRTLYDYNAWANRQILDSAAQLTPDQLRAAGSASFESIHETLVHTMSAQWMWLSRWQGSSPSAMLDPADYAGVAAIDARWRRIEQDTQDFMAGLDDTALARVVEYTNTKGQRYEYPLWQLMLHQVNHATQHRSEAAAMLTQFGHSPGWLDLIRYLDLPRRT
jgi:uncharacterized damage-inducible protein DinB